MWLIFGLFREELLSVRMVVRGRRLGGKWSLDALRVSEFQCAVNLVRRNMVEPAICANFVSICIDTAQLPRLFLALPEDFGGLKH